MRVLVLLWSLLGIVAILGQAIVRLGGQAARLWPLSERTVFELVLLGITVGAFAFFEGYRGFQTAFSPRARARAEALAERPTPALVVLAPLYCMGLFHATRKRLIVSWVLVIGIVGLIVLVRQLPFPWREICDAGVVVGLSWGAASVLVELWNALRRTARPVEPDLPAGSPLAPGGA